ncbi:hypothetical protein [Arthrobacter sp.]|uniref:hypothetical protein n=1 Tax=Arthrobacter sp. TaxID=1667 RepID=UPI0028975D7F|nr:hypothetical protein [Arthrobacter sp.]
MFENGKVSSGLAVNEVAPAHTIYRRGAFPRFPLPSISFSGIFLRGYLPPARLRDTAGTILSVPAQD